jgi:hypothetical protein
VAIRRALALVLGRPAELPLVDQLPADAQTTVLRAGAAGQAVGVNELRRWTVGAVGFTLRSLQARTIGVLGTEAQKAAEWSALNWAYDGQEDCPLFSVVANLAVPAGFVIEVGRQVYRRPLAGVAGANLAADIAQWSAVRRETVVSKATAFTVTAGDLDTYITLTTAAAVPLFGNMAAAHAGRGVKIKNSTSGTITVTLGGAATVVGSLAIPASGYIEAVVAAANTYHFQGNSAAAGGGGGGVQYLGLSTANPTLQATLQGLYDTASGAVAPDTVPPAVTTAAGAIGTGGYKVYLGHNTWWYTNAVTPNAGSWLQFNGGKSNFGATIDGIWTMKA